MVQSPKVGGTNSAFRVLVVDDFDPWQSVVSRILQKHMELRIVGRASDGLAAVRTAEELQPDLILLDVGLTSLNGIEVARRIRDVSPASKILFVSENRSLEIVREALSTGAADFVIKCDAGHELLSAVKVVLGGKRYVSASLARHFLVATTFTMAQTVLSWMSMLISGSC